MGERLARRPAAPETARRRHRNLYHPGAWRAFAGLTADVRAVFGTPGGPLPIGWDTGAMDLDPAVAARLKRNDAGLLPAIAQQQATGEVLMLGWMDDEALARTLATRRATYWSRSRGDYWTKGETSGHRQWVRRVSLDCDGDTLLLQVEQEGPACHTGTRTCFDDGRIWEPDA
jgi:phosphoribosyl-AMP cyclohydrolase